MALTGSMRDFGISEILQLIGQQKKGGTLIVKDKTRRLEVLFDQGNIVSATHTPTEPAFDLASLLSRSGAVSAAKIEAARKAEKQTLKPLPEVLLQDSALSPEDLRAFITLANLEAIYSIFLWKDGDYSFEAGPVNYLHQHTDPISSEQVLMDGYRIKDEWPLLSRAIPDLRMKPAKTPGEFGPDDKLDPAADRIYRLINGERTVEDIVFLARMGRFETLKLIKDLLDGGRIKLGARAAEEEKKAFFSGAWLQGLTMLAVAAALFFEVLGAARLMPRLWGEVPDHPGVETRQKVQALYQQDRAGSAVLVHLALAGTFPAGLDVLVQEKRLRPSDLVTPWGPLKYELFKDGTESRVSTPGGGGGPADKTSANGG